MEKSNLFFGGVPVEPDEMKLKEAYPDMALSSFRVLTEEEKLEKAIRHRGKAKKQVIKGARVLTITDRNALPEAKRGMYDLWVLAMDPGAAVEEIREASAQT